MMVVVVVAVVVVGADPYVEINVAMDHRAAMVAAVMVPCRHDDDTGPVMIVMVAVTVIVIGHRDPAAH